MELSSDVSVHYLRELSVLFIRTYYLAIFYYYTYRKQNFFNYLKIFFSHKNMPTNISMHGHTFSV